MNELTLLIWMIVLLVCLLFYFLIFRREKVKDWDNDLIKLLKKKDKSDQFFNDLPTVSYSKKKVAQGEVIEELSLHCSSYSLREALEGIFTLKELETVTDDKKLKIK